MPYRKLYFAIALTALLVLGFIATSVISYFVAHDSLSDRIAEETLPLTSDNIYSEIERDLLRSILISSLMAHDTFVRDWATGGESDPDRIIRYLDEIQRKYETTTTFFVSENTRRYYHPSGVLETVERSDATDAWYFRVRSMNEPYEVNVDADSADPNRLTIFINYRVTDAAGNHIGVTGVGLAVDTVAELIESYQQRYDRSIYFADREGIVTLHGAGYSGAARIQDTPGMRPIAPRLLATAGTDSRYVGAQGSTVYVNSRLIPEFGWYLIVEQSESAAETRILNTLLLNIAIALGVTALVCITAWFTVRGYQLRLEEMATTDPLTGGANRQVFELLFSQATKVSRRRGVDASLITLDIDDFKPINDTWGHEAGDAVLRTVATILRDHIRESDTVCRWGGDEFVVLLTDCDEHEARRIADKIRCAVKERPIRYAGRELQVTVSLGVAEHEHGEPLTAVLARADAALYAAKRNGRDRIGE